MFQKWVVAQLKNLQGVRDVVLEMTTGVGHATGRETVSLISSFKDENDTTVGRLEVSPDFDYLLKDIKAHGWWQSDMAGLVDDAG